MSKITIEIVNNLLRESNWKCLSSEYKNLDTTMTFQCNEGHKIHSTWGKLRKKQVCPVCENNRGIQIRETSAKNKKSGVRRIIAFDQSSKVCGYAVMDDLELVGYGVYETTKRNSLDRIVDICDWMLSMIRSWKPDSVGFEETQYNPQSGMGHDVFKLLSQVMGAAMLSAAREKVQVETVLIPTWRSHCGVKGNKRADQKRSAQLLIKKWYDVTVTDDEADAICQAKYFSETFKKRNEAIIGEWIDGS